MPDDNLTAAQCDELAEALFEEAARFARGVEEREHIAPGAEPPQPRYHKRIVSSQGEPQ
jgi:hypothetical protein